VRPKREFQTFRSQDVGKRGGIERVAGQRSSGSWDTQKWLISKSHAHLERGRLVADTADARRVLNALGPSPVHLRGDRFRAEPRPNVPERQSQRRLRSAPARAIFARRKRLAGCTDERVAANL